IHRKPGYDPCELFLDPELSLPKWQIAKFLLKKKLGLRGLLEVIPLDASLVKGSHGRDRVPEDEQPLWMGTDHPVRSAEDLHAAILECFRSKPS
ncbi:MAG: alkaline phosphatase family protein, partial [Akkermansiaceae bacterium]|nr:alkaline phosphatase family protein [Akkermansiaceae bacterium]